MATGQPAYKKEVYVSTNNTTWVQVPISDASLNFGADVLDDTDSVNSGSTGVRSRVLGLQDWSVSMSCMWDSSETVYATIRNAMLNRTALYMRYLPDAVLANGYTGQVVVESYNQSGAVADLESIEISLQANGALAAAA